VNIKKFSDMPYRDKSNVIAGALLLVGLFALLANWAVSRDKKDESNDKGRADD
jgi:uncharacterized membrane protein (GlpM family)